MGPAGGLSQPRTAPLPPRPNCRPLSPALRQRVQREWAPFYRDFGYSLEGGEGEEDEEEEAAPSAPPLAHS